MRILLAAATTNEIYPTIEWLKSAEVSVDVLITGVGSTAAAYQLTRAVCLQKPDMVIQAGIGGSFSTSYPPGSVVIVREEVIADLGAVEQGRLTDVFDMGFAAGDNHPFTERMLRNPSKYKYQLDLDLVRGATVNAITSAAGQLSMIREKYDPVIESMEGAALHYICLMEHIPFLQLRAVSNFVGERNKANWKFKEAISELNVHLKKIILQLSNDHIN